MKNSMCRIAGVIFFMLGTGFFPQVVAQTNAPETLTLAKLQSCEDPIDFTYYAPDNASVAAQLSYFGSFFGYFDESQDKVVPWRTSSSQEIVPLSFIAALYKRLHVQCGSPASHQISALKVSLGADGNGNLILLYQSLLLPLSNTPNIPDHSYTIPVDDGIYYRLEKNIDGTVRMVEDPNAQILMDNYVATMYSVKNVTNDRPDVFDEFDDTNGAQGDTRSMLIPFQEIIYASGNYEGNDKGYVRFRHAAASYTSAHNVPNLPRWKHHLLIDGRVDTIDPTAARGPVDNNNMCPPYCYYATFYIR